MTEIWAGAGLFAFVLTGVVIAGYVYQRLTEHRGVEGPGVPPGDRLANAPSAVASLFQSIGENFPAAKNEKNPYRMRLASAGYRWPASIPERVLRGTPVNAGQGVGVVAQSVGVAELVTGLRDGALALLSRWS